MGWVPGDIRLVTSLQTVCLVVLIALMLIPGLYGFHLLMLAILAQRQSAAIRRRQAEIIDRFTREVPDEDWPVVTTQIPLYNELPVARRVIEAVAAMDYPPALHEIQILDDSTDGTRHVVDHVARTLRRQGYDVQVIRRPNRENYKAGALEYGLAQARGEFVAIFDADFVPGRDFLRRLIPLIASDPRACCVQGRWGHLNSRESWITEALSVGIDGHFAVEQAGRGWNGFLINFNGTAGVWRRAAIEDPRVGGWSGDTITEDLDLSYRAQLAGWRLIYHLDEVAPAEVPADVTALKAQQRRWATGSIQTARKLVPAIWRSDLSLIQKLEATFHLAQYSINVFMLLAIVFGRVLVELVAEVEYRAVLAWSAGPCLAAAASSWAAYVYARRVASGVWLGPLGLLRLIILGLGISLNNTIAVLTGLVQRGGEFVRTPKSGATGAVSRRARKQQLNLPRATIRSRLWLLELLLGGFCIAQWLWFLRADGYFGGTFLLLYGIGLIWLGWESRPSLAAAGVRRRTAAGRRRLAEQSEPVADPVVRINV